MAIELKLFAVMYDGDNDYVEAVTMRDAIAVWHVHMKLQNGDDWYGDEEPESCSLVVEKPVLRALGEPASSDAVDPDAHESPNGLRV